jgi:hypothetical protein
MALVGKCSGCGSENTLLLDPQYQVLIDMGQKMPTCASCQEHVLGKHYSEIQRNHKLSDEERSRRLKELRNPPKVEEPAKGD